MINANEENIRLDSKYEKRGIEFVTVFTTIIQFPSEIIPRKGVTKEDPWMKTTIFI